MEAFIIFVGGGLGAVLRYGVYAFASLCGLSYLGTFTANILACIILGAVMHFEIDKNPMNEKLRLFFVTGLVGSFSTFSTYNYEVLNMFNGQFKLGITYLIASFVIGMMAITFGFWLESIIFRKKVADEENL